MVTVKQAWIGFVLLFLVVMLIVTFAVYWQHVTGMNTLHMLLAEMAIPYPVGQGC